MQPSNFYSKSWYSGTDYSNLMHICLKNTQLKVSWKVIVLININFQHFDAGNSSGSPGGNIHFRANFCSLNHLTVNIALEAYGCNHIPGHLLWCLVDWGYCLTILSQSTTAKRFCALQTHANLCKSLFHLFKYNDLWVMKTVMTATNSLKD